jgi:NAD(P)-dependent dehydrogenase (short-subunit alcohol dehydrogenase family)
MTSRMGSIADNTSGGSYGYRMSKVALSMAGKSLAHDLRPQGIAVAILHPGLVQTRMTGFTKGGITPAESVAGLLARIDALTLETSGTFWHANGEVLPW